MAPMKDPNEKKLESSYVYYVESHLVKKFNDLHECDEISSLRKSVHQP